MSGELRLSLISNRNASQLSSYLKKALVWILWIAHRDDFGALRVLSLQVQR